LTGFLVFLLPFIVVLASVFPGLFDTTMMSRLAVFPMAGSVILFAGRKNVTAWHLLTGTAVALLPAITLLWATSSMGGIPFAVRWFSFGIMITGFSGTISRWGLKPHMYGLVAAAVVTSTVMLVAGPDAVTGNSNRAGMLLSMGFVGNLIVFNKNRWYSWVSTVLISAGMISSFFYIGWIACATGTGILFLSGKLKIRAWMILSPMIAGQILFTAFPEYAGRIGPSLELRSRIWHSSFSLFQEQFPLGTGCGSARIEIFNSASPELRTLSGGDRRVDYLHSEPLTMVTESGIFGLLLLALFLYWFIKKCRSPEQLALLTAFWPVFTSDLPLATPLGALPAALFLGSLAPLTGRKVVIPVAVPVFTMVLSIYWGFTVIAGYSAMGAVGREVSSVSDIEHACRRIPWEERAFLAAGHTHLRSNMVIAALEDSRHFLELYPSYYRGWELRATALDAAGRNSCSAWARATLLVPDNIYFPEKYLFAINAIQSLGMDADTAVAVSRVLSYSREQMSELLDRMSASDLLVVSEKMLILSEQCRPASKYHASRMWFMAMATACKSGEQIPSELVFNLVSGRDLYTYLDQDWKPKADEYLEFMTNETGMEQFSVPSP